jgi:hypothetical protein
MTTNTSLSITAGRTIRGALLVRGDVVRYNGAVLSIRTGSTKKLVRVCTAWDHTHTRQVTIRPRRDAELEVIRLITDD